MSFVFLFIFINKKMNQKERENKVVSLYLEGRDCTSISRAVRIERKSVYRILERNQITLRPVEKKKCALCDNIILIEKEKNRLCCPTCNTNIRRYRVKKKAVEYKGGKCVKCSWDGDISGFDFHHLDPKEKDFNLVGKNIAPMKWELVTKELDKCILLCALCHRLEHSNYRDSNFLSIAENTE